MKLSDVKGERSFDVIAEIIDPIFVITEDEEAMSLFQKQTLPKGQTQSEFGMHWLKQLCDVLLKKHKKECIQILASIEGVSVKKYKDSLTPIKLFSDVAELISDEAFRALFFSQTTQKAGTSSGSVSENTEAQET